MAAGMMVMRMTIAVLLLVVVLVLLECGRKWRFK